MRNWHRLLIISGLFLILGGFLFGLAFSQAVNHQARLVAHDAYAPVFERIVSGSAGGEEWQTLTAEARRNSVAHRRAADVHGHAINMGVLLILVGLITPVLTAGGEAGPRKGHRTILILALSAVVYPAGLLLQYFGLTRAGEGVAALGAVAAILSLLLLCLRIWKAIDRNFEAGM